MCLPFSSAYTTLPQTPKPLRQMDPTPTPRALPALWVLNPVIFLPLPAPRMLAQKSPHNWLRLGEADSGSSFHPLLLASGPTSRISSEMAALFSRNSRRHPESPADFGL